MKDEKESSLDNLGESSLDFSNGTGRSTRKRKPTARYLEEDSDLNILNRIFDKKDRKKRSIMKTESKSKTKWTVYKDRISYLARSVARDQHTIDTYDVTTGSDFISKNVIIPKNEIRIAQARIYKGKQSIYDLFQELASENLEHTKWLKLKKGYDSEDSVDIEDIMCSVCNLPDEENNDILFCDRANCLRAYHMKCLDPPIRSLDSLHEDEDWFCHQCTCMDECLDLVGEVLGNDCNDHRELFPELRIASSHEDEEGGGGQTTSATGQLEDSESEDEDYNPDEISTGSQGHVKAESEAEDSSVGSQAHKKAKYSDVGSSSLKSTVGSSSSINSIDTDTVNSSDNDTSDDDHSSTMDEGELEGLLMDAEVTQEELAQQAQDTRTLRPRRSKQSTGVIQQSVEGEADIGKDIAVVRRGRLVLGIIVGYGQQSDMVEGALEQNGHCSSSSASIVHSLEEEGVEQGPSCIDTLHASVSDNCSPSADPTVAISTPTDVINTTAITAPTTVTTTSTTAPTTKHSRQEEELESGRWALRLEDGQELEVGISTLREYFNLYQEYKHKLAEEDNIRNANKKTNGEEQQEGIDEANVLSYKRSRKRLDYVALSLQMFGTLSDQDEEGDAPYIPPGRTPLSDGNAAGADDGASDADSNAPGADDGASDADGNAPGADDGASDADGNAADADDGASDADGNAPGADDGASDADSNAPGADDGASDADGNAVAADDGGLYSDAGASHIDGGELNADTTNSNEYGLFSSLQQRTPMESTRKRGRPRKTTLVNNTTSSPSSIRQRGQPRKLTNDSDAFRAEDSVEISTGIGSHISSTPTKKRGRPLGSSSKAMRGLGGSTEASLTTMHHIPSSSNISTINMFKEQIHTNVAVSDERVPSTTAKKRGRHCKYSPSGKQIPPLSTDEKATGRVYTGIEYSESGEEYWPSTNDSSGEH